MLGASGGRQDRLFYEFDLETVVPADHLLWRIDAAVDLSWLRGEMRPHYSHWGTGDMLTNQRVQEFRANVT